MTNKFRVGCRVRAKPNSVTAIFCSEIEGVIVEVDPGGGVVVNYDNTGEILENTEDLELIFPIRNRIKNSCDD